MNGMKFQTPLGTGTFEGFMPVLGSVKLLIRLPINTTTEPHKRDSNCVTKGAIGSGLWLFAQTDVKVVQS
jgi:hypothetical protein